MKNLHKITKVGIHLRLKNSLADLAQQAIDMGASHLQFFLTSSTKHNRYITLEPEEQKAFQALRPFLNHIYIHSSYWINLATGKPQSSIISQNLLKKELSLARKLNLTKLVLHPGAANGFNPALPHEVVIKKGIEKIATTLNETMKLFPEMTILLENTTHSNFTIGSNMEDFIALKELLNFPERIGFCLDFAHAFSYGYSLNNPESFYKLVNATMGLNNLQLIHLNDTIEHQGSKKDTHALPGEGKIGLPVLKKLIDYEPIKNIPLILEPPALSNSKLSTVIKNFNLE